MQIYMNRDRWTVDGKDFGTCHLRDALEVVNHRLAGYDRLLKERNLLEVQYQRQADTILALRHELVRIENAHLLTRAKSVDNS